MNGRCGKHTTITKENLQKKEGKKMPANVENYVLQETEEQPATLESQEKGNGKKLSLKDRTQRRQSTGKGKKIMRKKDKELESSDVNELFGEDDNVDELGIEELNTDDEIIVEEDVEEELHEEALHEEAQTQVEVTTSTSLIKDNPFLSSKIKFVDGLRNRPYKAEIVSISLTKSEKTMLKCDIPLKGGAKYRTTSFHDSIAVKGNSLYRLTHAFEDEIQTYGDLIGRKVWISVRVSGDYENAVDFADPSYSREELKVDQYGRFIWE